MRWCNVWITRLNPLKWKVSNFSKKAHLTMSCPLRMDIINLKAKKSVKFLGFIFDLKLTFGGHIKPKINNSQHIASSLYSLKSHQYRISNKTLIIYIRFLSGPILIMTMQY